MGKVRFDQKLDQLSEEITDALYDICDKEECSEIGNMLREVPGVFLSGLMDSPEKLEFVQKLALFGYLEAIRRARVKFVESDEQS